ncbi:MAG TPA: hypothetical protein VN408_34795 [Actinoplanes sp.]|nr:hypothetical protein [Actinoplanes sp.]
MIVVDERHRLPIGRPYITVAIDVLSRAIVGLVVTLDAPSALSVGLRLAHMVTGKRAWLERIGVDVAWPCLGPEGFEPGRNPSHPQLLFPFGRAAPRRAVILGCAERRPAETSGRRGASMAAQVPRQGRDPGRRDREQAMQERGPSGCPRSVGVWRVRYGGGVRPIWCGGGRLRDTAQV